MKKQILIGFLIWNAAGLLFGALESAMERDSYSKPNTGCVYNSIAAFTNPGHILGCELVRKRFTIE